MRKAKQNNHKISREHEMAQNWLEVIDGLYDFPHWIRLMLLSFLKDSP